MHHEIEPFNFPKPILVINENCTEGVMNYTDKSLALWDLNIINFQNILPLAHDIFPLVRLYSKPTWMLNNYLDRSYHA
jgi:hypothetical protein